MVADHGSGMATYKTKKALYYKVVYVLLATASLPGFPVQSQNKIRGHSMTTAINFQGLNVDIRSYHYTLRDMLLTVKTPCSQVETTPPYPYRPMPLHAHSVFSVKNPTDCSPTRKHNCNSAHGREL